eukprot:TRINITY_DN3469_c0_g1_i2.p2 TRINITY_DN3469_c0_g1~~TRINITY_DN3469_c0_g1_i2.p2  ORF type:complete len:217 (+),score=56.55 TRINITY_DN3469_c0_g1_i2:88-651(+)
MAPDFLISELLAASAMSAEGPCVYFRPARACSPTRSFGFFWGAFCLSTAKQSYVDEATALLQRAAAENWPVATLEAALAKTKLNTEQSQAWARFWRAQSAKIHDALYQNSTWDNRLAKFSWRIDVQSKSKTSQELHQPCAVLEMALAPAPVLGGEAKPELLRMELDKAELARLVATIDTIQQLLVRG